MFVLEHPNTLHCEPAGGRGRIPAAPQCRHRASSWPMTLRTCPAPRWQPMPLTPATRRRTRMVRTAKAIRRARSRREAKWIAVCASCCSLSAHMGEEYSLSELAVRFIGVPKNDDERKKFVQTIHKDINTLTTVLRRWRDGWQASSSTSTGRLLEAEGIVCATNSPRPRTSCRNLAAIHEHAHRIGELSGPMHRCCPPRNAAKRLTSMTACASMWNRVRPPWLSSDRLRGGNRVPSAL